MNLLALNTYDHVTWTPELWVQTWDTVLIPLATSKVHDALVRSNQGGENAYRTLSNGLFSGSSKAGYWVSCDKGSRNEVRRLIIYYNTLVLAKNRWEQEIDPRNNLCMSRRADVTIQQLEDVVKGYFKQQGVAAMGEKFQKEPCDCQLLVMRVHAAIRLNKFIA